MSKFILTKNKLTLEGDLSGVVFLMRHSSQRGRTVETRARNSTVIGVPDFPTLMQKIHTIKSIWKMWWGKLMATNQQMLEELLQIIDSEYLNENRFIDDYKKELKEMIKDYFNGN